jgi:hypothetical protein
VFSSVRRNGLFFLLAASLLMRTAAAQLPQVTVPPVQVPGVGPVLPEATRVVGGTLRELSNARSLRGDRLLRENRAQLDRDARGELVIRAEVVAIDITPAALDRAIEAKFKLLRTEELADLAVRISILQTPEGVSATRGLKRLRKLDPGGTYDYNHVYLDSGEVGGVHAQFAPIPRVNDTATSGGASHRVGLIDGGVDAGHQALAGLRLHHFGCGGTQVPSARETIV